MVKIANMVENPEYPVVENEVEKNDVPDVVEEVDKKIGIKWQDRRRC